MQRITILMATLALLPACGFIGGGTYQARLDDYDNDGDGYVSTDLGGDDCDDDNASIKPGADELCNDADDDCDGEIDEVGPTVSYPDTDGDGYGDPDGGAARCPDSDGWVDNADDCDDSDVGINPLAAEVCNDVDDDCDNLVDGDDTELVGGEEFWFDNDGDGFAGSSSSVISCTAPDGYAALEVDGSDVDCNDADAAVNPDAIEVCKDNTDNDCDGAIDSGNGVGGVWYADADGDGFGDEAASEQSCKPYSVELSDGTIVRYVPGPKPEDVDYKYDCDDDDGNVFPGADVNVCDLVDTDCDGVIEEYRVAKDDTLDFTTIQEAIDEVADWSGDDVTNAEPGQLVCVTPETYRETLFIENKNLRLWSTDGPQATVVNAGGVRRDQESRQLVAVEDDNEDPVETGPVIYIEGGPDSVEVRGFRVTGGTGYQDSETKDLGPEDDSIEVSWDTTAGAGVVVIGGSPTLRDLHVVNNLVDEPNGLALGAGITLLESSAVVQDVAVVGNASYSRAGAIGEPVFGGVVAVLGGVPTFERLVMYENSCTLIHDSDLDPEKHAEPVFMGGCAFGLLDSSTRLSNVLAYRNNVVAEGEEAMIGASILFVGGTSNPVIENSTFAHNDAVSDSVILGGITHYGSIVVGLTNVDVSENTFRPGKLWPRLDWVDLDPNENVEDIEYTFVSELPAPIAAPAGGDYMLRNVNVFGNKLVAVDPTPYIDDRWWSYAELLVESGDPEQAVEQLGLAVAESSLGSFDKGDDDLSAVVSRGVAFDSVGFAENGLRWIDVNLNSSITWNTGSSSGNIEVDPGYVGCAYVGAPFDLRLGEGSKLIDAGDATLKDEDGSRSGIGVYGGPEPLGWTVDDIPDGARPFTADCDCVGPDCD